MINFLAKLVGLGASVRSFGSKPKERISNWTRAIGIDPNEKVRRDLMNKAESDLNLERERIRANINSQSDAEKKAA